MPSWTEENAAARQPNAADLHRRQRDLIALLDGQQTDPDTPGLRERLVRVAGLLWQAQAIGCCGARVQRLLAAADGILDEVRRAVSRYPGTTSQRKPTAAHRALRAPF